MDYYRLLNYNEEKNIPIDENWFGVEHKTDEQERNRMEADIRERTLAMYHTNPLQVTLKESLKDEVKMYHAWVDFKVRLQLGNNRQSNGLRFALIRLRISRKPKQFMTNVILPFFIIVSSSFSIFAISPAEPANRLGVSVGILLTFTAFQSVVGDSLPQTSEVYM